MALQFASEAMKSNIKVFLVAVHQDKFAGRLVSEKQMNEFKKLVHDGMSNDVMRNIAQIHKRMNEKKRKRGNPEAMPRNQDQ